MTQAGSLFHHRQMVLQVELASSQFQDDELIELDTGWKPVPPLIEIDGNRLEACSTTQLFTQAGSLFHHTVIHTGWKPVPPHSYSHRLEACSTTQLFTQAGSLFHHTVIDTGWKPVPPHSA
ncbi:hypothetical protein [Moorena sp. SIOASIH]|uniref:hypothetical protein n=1 Tax=Moorena sp. SIOASIH TaxID=2607817 RepID=UPI0025E58FFA|nr:hypothetical protein [Moorena sp. SIOASIH]